MEVKKAKNNLSEFYSSNVKNITLLIGKNGTGKTTLLKQILGMNRSDRFRNSVRNNKIINEYFILFYLGKNQDGKEVFGIEFTGYENIIKSIKNLEMSQDDSNYRISKNCIGVQVVNEKNKFLDTREHFFNRLFRGDNFQYISDLINIVVPIDKKTQTDRKSANYGSEANEKDNLLAKRKYLLLADEATKYNTILELKNNSAIGFVNQSTSLVIKDNLDDKIYDLDDKFSKVLKDKLGEIEKRLPLFRKKFRTLQRKRHYKKMDSEMKEKFQSEPLVIPRHMRVRITEQKKKKYILNLYSKFILNMIQFIINQISELDNIEKSNKVHPVYIDANEKTHINFIENLGTQGNTSSIIGKPTNVIVEIENILTVIKHYQLQVDTDLKTNVQTLKSIGRYVYSRVNAIQNFGEDGYYIIVAEEYIDMLTKLNDYYFEDDKIEIQLIKNMENRNHIFDKDVHSILQHISKYRGADEERQNNIQQLANVHFSKLSDGENSLIETLSKVLTSTRKRISGGLTIVLLDEPDRSLHPEWSRIFVNYLVDVLEKLKSNVQFVMTTHSPYMLSDFFPQNVYTLKREKEEHEGKLQIARIPNKNSSFGANIYDLLKNSFFMNNSIGEFATRQINQLVSEIKEMDDRTTKEKMEMIEFYISHIGEPALSQHIQKIYQQKKKQIDISKNSSKIKKILEIISDENEQKRVRELLEEEEGK